MKTYNVYIICDSCACKVLRTMLIDATCVCVEFDASFAFRMFLVAYSMICT